MASYNKVILIGNMTRDPELTRTANGHDFCKFSIACNHRYKTESGELREEPVFLDCKCFGLLAVSIHQHFRKGKAILVEGRLVNDKWTDNETGKEQSRVRVLCEHYRFVGSKDDAKES